MTDTLINVGPFEAVVRATNRDQLVKHWRAVKAEVAAGTMAPELLSAYEAASKARLAMLGDQDAAAMELLATELGAKPVRGGGRR